MNTLKSKIIFTAFIFFIAFVSTLKAHATVSHTLTMDIAGDQHINASALATSVDNPSATITCTAPSEAVKICTQEFLENSNITITATPGNGEMFVSWIGCDSTNGNVCLIKLTSDRHSYANFKKGEASSSDGTYHVLAPIPGFGNPGDPAINADFKLGTYVATIFKIGIGLAGLLAVIMIIIGGITYMMSDVIGEKEGGKDMITNAIFGLLLAIGSYAILNTINPDVISLRFVTGEPAPATIPNPVTGGGGGNGTNNGASCGSTYVNNSAWPPATMATTERDVVKRASLVNVSVNKNDCAYVGQTNCTSLDGLAQQAITKVNALKAACPTCSVVITGGTECWLHSGSLTSHAPNSSVVDLNKSGIFSFVQSHSGAPTNIGWGQQYIITGVPSLNGAKFVDEATTPSNEHFHIISW